MSLKHIINRHKIINQVVNRALVLPGEPILYSIKYSLGNKSMPVQHFRNKQWYSILKCHFSAYNDKKTPVVLFLRFYLSPPEGVDVSRGVLEKEETPAVSCNELCDFGLAILESIKHALLDTYRQVVKLDMEKYYSSRPRIELKFMKWEHYVKLQNNDPIYAEAKGKRGFKPAPAKMVHTTQPRDEYYEYLPQKESPARLVALERAAARDSAFPATDTQELEGKTPPEAPSVPAHKKARRRQPRKAT